jgi:hypothetical protein
MARTTNVETQMKRLRLKKEELDMRIRQDEIRKKLREVKTQLKATGGRIR